MCLPPLRRVRFVFPVPAPLRDIVRQGHTIVAFIGTPRRLLMAPQTLEVGILRRPSMSAFDPLVVVGVELVTGRAEVQFLMSVTDIALRIVPFQFIHKWDLLALLFVPPEVLVALHPVVILMVFVERGKLEAVALGADAAVDQYLAVHVPLRLPNIFVTSEAIKAAEGLLYVQPMPRRLVVPHVAMAGLAYRVGLEGGGDVSDFFIRGAHPTPGSVGQT